MLITKLQCQSISGVLNFNDNSDIKSIEDNIVSNTLEIIKIVLNLKQIVEKKLVLLNPLNSPIAVQYANIAELSQFNSDDIEWVEVFSILSKNVNYLPIKSIINKYVSDIENKKLLYLHYESFIYEVIKCILEITS